MSHIFGNFKVTGNINKSSVFIYLFIYLFKVAGSGATWDQVFLKHLMNYWFLSDGHLIAFLRVFFLIFFKMFILFLRERERERERERHRAQAGQGQRKGETQNVKQAPGSELSAWSLTRGSNPRTMRS